MNNKGKSLLIIVVAIALLSLAAASAIFYFYQKEKAANANLQEQLEELRAAQRLNESKLEEANRRIMELEAKRKEAETKISTLIEQLQQEKMAKDQALLQIQQVRDDLEQQKRLRADLEKKFEQAQAEVMRVQSRIKDLEAQRTDLERKMSELEAKAQAAENVELGTIVVAPTKETTEVKKPSAKKEKDEKKDVTTKLTKDVNQPYTKTTPASSGAEGKVLVVNRDYNFAVINLGSKDGVNIGSVFSIYHNNEYIGDAKVEKVHDSMAAGGFLSPDIRDKVSEGDRIILKK